MDLDSSTFSGLCAILDSSKTSVSRACLAVEECIASNRDNLRGFFEQCFPTLLRRLFGYDGTSWLAQVAKGGRDTDAKALLRLLAPNGPLFSAMVSADADGSIRFHFPRERLPTHTQMMLATPAGRKELESWPQYAKSMVPDASGRPHIHVGVTQYFIYWFAFYAMKGGDAGSGAGLGGFNSSSSGTAGFGSSVRKAADVFNLARAGKDAEIIGHPYTALLRQLLLDLLPRPASAGGAAASPVKASPIPATRSSTPGSAYYRSPLLVGGRTGDVAARGVLFLSVLEEFWLTDGDEPVPVAQAAALSERDRAAPLWATSYEPPSEDSLEALAGVVKHITVAENGRGGVRPAQSGSGWLPLTPLHILTPSPQGVTTRSGGSPLAGPFRLGAAAQPGAQAFARRLFRLFHRAFSMWPDQRTIKPMLRLFIAYLAPWQTAASSGSAGNSALAAHLTQYKSHVSDLVHRASRHDSASGGDGRYSSEWQQHVLSNLPFYLILVPLFMERSVSRISARGETAAADVMTVLGVLGASSELIDTLQRVEQDLGRYASTQPRRAEGPYAELLPWLYEQLVDWETAATATCLGDSALGARTAANTTNRAGNAAPPTMFSTGEGGAAWVGREILDLSGRVLKEEPLKRLKRYMEAVLPLSRLPDHPAGEAEHAAAAAQDEAVPRLPKSTWRDVRYKGDPLQKPVTSYEWAPLARTLVAASIWLNAKLGLDVPLTPEEESQPAENRVQEMILRLRRSGFRINLRVFADVRTLAWLPVAYMLVVMVFRVISTVFWALLSVPSADKALTGDSGRYHQHHQHWQ